MQLLEVLVTSLPGHAQNRLTLPKNAHPILQNQLHPAHRSDSLALVPKVGEIPGALITALGKEKINPARCQWLPPTVDIQQEILEEHFTPLFSSRQRSKTCGSWAKSCVWGVCVYMHRDRRMPQSDVVIKPTSGLSWGSGDTRACILTWQQSARADWRLQPLTEFLLSFARVPTPPPHCVSYTRILLAMGSAPGWHLSGLCRHWILWHLLQVQFQGKIFGDLTQTGQSQN